MSAYGGTAPVDMTAVISAPKSVTAGSSVAVSFSTQAITLPTGVSSNATMQTVTDVAFSAVATVSGATGSVTLNSAAPTAVGTAGELPAMPSVTGNVTLATQGTAVVGQPATVQILPTDAQATKLTPITCSASTAAQSISIAVTPPTPTGTTPSAPAYGCKVYVNGKFEGTLPPMPLAESVRVTGKLTTGSTDTITWVSPPANQNGLGGPYTGSGFTVTRVIFQGSLPVTGAQQGSISLYRSTADAAITVLKVTGSLFLSQPGTVSIHLPQAFRFTVDIKGPKGATATSALACSTKNPPVAQTLKVTGNPVQPPTAQGSATPIATGTGTPVGAPNTGGGRPASNMPLVAGGAALLALGAGLAFTARRRRHSEN